MQFRRGFTMVEVLIAAVVAFLAFATFLTVFRGSYQLGSATRNRTVATIMAQSILEEIEAHPYGAVAPAGWSASVVETPTRIWIQGRPVDMQFTKKFSYRNSSFIDSTKTEDYDVVKCEIHWSESIGNRPSDKVLVFEAPVWR